MVMYLTQHVQNYKHARTYKQIFSPFYTSTYVGITHAHSLSLSFELGDLVGKDFICAKVATVHGYPVIWTDLSWDKSVSLHFEG